MITVTGLKKVYYQGEREVRALDGVNLSVPGNTVHGIVGQSGAGKSTLVRCLAMLDRPTAGTVEINGAELTAVHAADLRAARRRLGVVFQHANLFDSRTVHANVAYPLELAAAARPERDAKASELLRLVGLVEARDAYPAQLSGGQRQRVGIARALATDPDVLLLDEPTSALDPGTTDEILDLIASLRSRAGLAVVVITHEMHVVKRICDSVTLLEDGLVVESGSLGRVVARFGGRLSEALLSLPPHDPTAAGTFVDLLDFGPPDGIAALSRAERHFGVDLPVAAGVVESLAGITYRRQRVAVPDRLGAPELVGFLHAAGAGARLSGPAVAR